MIILRTVCEEEEYIKKVLITKFTPSSVFILFFGSKCSVHHSVSNAANTCSSVARASVAKAKDK
jgi:hypothetical protein